MHKSSLLQRVPLGCFAAIALLVTAVAGLQAADDLVVIVNKTNPVDSISANDLKKMFLGEKAVWANGAKVTAVTPGPDRPEYNAAIKKATGMSSADFKRYFIQLSFLGRAAPPPRAFDAPGAAARFVSANPGAIACVPASEATGPVKSLKVQ
jgi:hypothetical protein